MKTESYILRYGCRQELQDLAAQKLSEKNLYSPTKAAAFSIKAQLAQQMMSGIDTLELVIIENDLFIRGEGNALSFTV